MFQTRMRISAAFVGAVAAAFRALSNADVGLPFQEGHASAVSLLPSTPGFYDGRLHCLGAGAWLAVDEDGFVSLPSAEFSL